VARQRGFPPRSRRVTDWGFGPSAVNQGFTATGALLWSGGVTANSQRVTLVRIRGMIHLFLTVAAAAGDGFFGACGIGIVTDQAFAAGQGSMPEPFDEADWDGWLWHQFFDVRTLTTVLGDGVNSKSASIFIPIDSKAMRKLEQPQVLFGSTQVVETGTATLTMEAQTRALFKLS